MDKFLVNPNQKCLGLTTFQIALLEQTEKMEITAFSFAKLGKGSNELIMEVGSGSHIAYLLKQEPHFLLLSISFIGWRFGL